nr:hypothetical protein [Proteus mirabilis]
MKQPNWTLQLPETIRVAMSRPFSWGKFDCCIFASECIDAQCGFSPIKPYLNHYKTKAEAFNLIKSKFGSLEKPFHAISNPLRLNAFSVATSYCLKVRTVTA